MTEAQQEALADAFLKLEAEFAHVMIVVLDKERPGEFVQPDEEVVWSGGWIGAMILVVQAGKKIEYRKHLQRCPPNVTPEVMRKAMQKFMPQNSKTTKPKGEK